MSNTQTPQDEEQRNRPGAPTKDNIWPASPQVTYSKPDNKVQQDAPGGSIFLGVVVSIVPYVIGTLFACYELVSYLDRRYVLSLVWDAGLAAVFFGPIVVCVIAAGRLVRYRKTFLGMALGGIIGFVCDISIYFFLARIFGGALS